jgi:hypothetical protein
VLEARHFYPEAFSVEDSKFTAIFLTIFGWPSRQPFCPFELKTSSIDGFLEEK